MKYFSLSLLAVLASSGSLFAQATDFELTSEDVRFAPSGSYSFKVRGKVDRYTMCTFEICRRDKFGNLTLMPIAAGSASTVLAQASDPESESYIVFYPEGEEGKVSSRRILRNRYMVELEEGADLNLIRQRCGMKSIKRLVVGSRFAVCEESNPAQVLSQIDRVATDPDIVSVEPIFAKKRQHKALPNDPFISKYDLVNNPQGYPDEESYQWYLKNLGFNGATPGIDLNMEPDTFTETGNGVVVSVVDDGIAWDHTDLSSVPAAGNPIAPNPHLNLVEENRDPGTFDVFSNHGTAVAGLIGGGANDGGMAGVAPNCTVSGVRLLGGFTDEIDEAIALLWGMAPIPNLSSVFEDPIAPGQQGIPFVDISNNSWGPDDTVLDFDKPSPLILDALRQGIIEGRGGLGGIFVWSAGNGGRINDNSNYDGFANSKYTIAVGGVNDAGVKPLYAESGANLVVVAPTDGGAQSILTTDFEVGLDQDGNPIRIPTYRTDFGGTSASAPLVSGVVALMLEANDQLTWRDVQDILVRTTIKNDPRSGGWYTNSAGLHFNHDYGAGLVDAEAAVRAARDRATGAVVADIGDELYNPRLLVNEHLTGEAGQVAKSFFYNRSDPNSRAGFVPDYENESPKSLNIEFDFSDEENLDMEHVEVRLTALTQNRSDLELVLISPSGTQSILQESDQDHKEQGISGWTFNTLRNWGEDSKGLWVLRISDKIEGNIAIINDATITINGAPDPDGSNEAAAVFVSSQLIDITQGETVSYAPEAVGAASITLGSYEKYPELEGSLSYDEEKNLITGTPPAAGLYSLPIKITSITGVESTAIVTLLVRPAEEALAGALGFKGYKVFTSSDNPWTFEFTDTNKDTESVDDTKLVASARSALGLKDSQQSAFGFNAVPKGVLFFDWKTSSEEGYDRLWFNLGGTIPQQWNAFISGEREWGTVAVMLPSEVNDVRWTYSKDGIKGAGDDSSGEDRGLLDNVRWISTEKYLAELRDPSPEGGFDTTTFPPVQLPNEPLISGFDVEIDSRTLWRPVAKFPPIAQLPDFRKAEALVSSSVGNGQTVSLSGWLEGPGLLTVNADNYAEESDLFEVLLDGIIINPDSVNGVNLELPAPPAPTRIRTEIVDYPISEGRHRLQLRHRKDFRGTLGRNLFNELPVDGVAINKITFKPEQSFQALASSLGIDGLLPEGDADGDGYSNHEEYAFGGDLLVADIPKNIPRLISKDGRNYIEYGIDTSKDDLNYAPQQSTNMSEWVDAQLTTLDRVEGDIEYYQIPVLSLPGRTHLFYRVVATPK